MKLKSPPPPPNTTRKNLATSLKQKFTERDTQKYTDILLSEFFKKVFSDTKQKHVC